MDACSIRSVFGAGIVIGDPGANVIQPLDLAAAGTPEVDLLHYYKRKNTDASAPARGGREEREGGERIERGEGGEGRRASSI
jgi:hypothetical protein